jgi:hypothetical protein
MTSELGKSNFKKDLEELISKSSDSVKTRYSKFIWTWIDYPGEIPSQINIDPIVDILEPKMIGKAVGLINRLKSKVYN